MKNWMTKQNVLIGSIVGSVLSGVIIFQENMHLCELIDGGYHRNCLFNDWMQDEIGLPLFYMSLGVFLISSILFFMRDEIFSTWLRFAMWWIPITIISILPAPSQSHDWMFHLDKGFVSFLMSVLFLFISIILIAYKHFTFKKN